MFFHKLSQLSCKNRVSFTLAFTSFHGFHANLVIWGSLLCNLYLFSTKWGNTCRAISPLHSSSDLSPLEGPVANPSAWGSRSLGEERPTLTSKLSEAGAYCFVMRVRFSVFFSCRGVRKLFYNWFWKHATKGEHAWCENTSASFGNPFWLRITYHSKFHRVHGYPWQPSSRSIWRKPSRMTQNKTQATPNNEICVKAVKACESQCERHPIFTWKLRKLMKKH